jgi:hypothetical protein
MLVKILILTCLLQALDSRDTPSEGKHDNATLNRILNDSFIDQTDKTWINHVNYEYSAEVSNEIDQQSQLKQWFRPIRRSRTRFIFRRTVATTTTLVPLNVPQISSYLSVLLNSSLFGLIGTTLAPSSTTTVTVATSPATTTFASIQPVNFEVDPPTVIENPTFTVDPQPVFVQSEVAAPVEVPVVDEEPTTTMAPTKTTTSATTDTEYYEYYDTYDTYDYVANKKT